MRQFAADLLLLAITLVWGSTFVIVKDAISLMGTFTFLAVRFAIAGVVLGAGCAVRSRFFSGSGETCARLTLEGTLARGAVVTGSVLFLAYATQTLGLQSVPAGKAAFITGLSVVLVPVGATVFGRSRIDASSVVGVGLSTVGLGLMSLKPPFSLGPGDTLIFVCAIAFAAHILLVGYYSSYVDPGMFTTIQLFVVSLGSFVAALIWEKPLYVPRAAMPAIVFTAVFGTSVAFLVQASVQRFTTTTHTALIFSAEPVFGAVFAWLLAGELLTAREMVGAGAILSGMLVSEFGGIRRTPRESLREEE